MNDLPLFLKRYVQSLAGCAYFFAGGCDANPVFQA